MIHVYVWRHDSFCFMSHMKESWCHTYTSNVHICVYISRYEAHCIYMYDTMTNLYMIGSRMSHGVIHIQIYDIYHIYTYMIHICVWYIHIYDTYICMMSLNIGHFCGKWPIKIRDPMSLRHPVCENSCMMYDIYTYMIRIYVWCHDVWHDSFLRIMYRTSIVVVCLFHTSVTKRIRMCDMTHSYLSCIASSYLWHVLLI